MVANQIGPAASIDIVVPSERTENLTRISAEEVVVLIAAGEAAEAEDGIGVAERVDPVSRVDDSQAEAEGTAVNRRVGQIDENSAAAGLSLVPKIIKACIGACVAAIQRVRSLTPGDVVIAVAAIDDVVSLMRTDGVVAAKSVNDIAV